MLHPRGRPRRRGRSPAARNRSGLGVDRRNTAPSSPSSVTDLCLLGATNEELGRVFGVDERTINRWLVTKPEFCQAVKNGRELADAQVARALYLKATGQWTQPAVKIAAKIATLHDGTVIKSEHIVEYVEHFPPDTAAAFIWLKNRQPHRWRDKKEVSATAESTRPRRSRSNSHPAPSPTSRRWAASSSVDDEPLEPAPAGPPTTAPRERRTEQWGAVALRTGRR